MDTTDASPCSHSLLAAVLAAVSLASACVRRKVPGAPVTTVPLLGGSRFLFFTEGLYGARLYPGQASHGNTFIVLFFRLVLGTIKTDTRKRLMRCQHCANPSPHRCLCRMSLERGQRVATSEMASYSPSESASSLWLRRV